MNKITVVLATYNGEQFIKEQLFSLLQQTRKADEVLISDDCSTDNTVEIIRSFIKSNGLDNWHLIVNLYNKGWKRNFIDLIFEAHGNLIFYCDQDDIWFDNKIEKMTTVFNENQEIKCLSCRYKSINQYGEILDKTIDKAGSETGEISKIPVNSKLFYYVPSGCTIAFRRELLDFISNVFFDCGADRIICRTSILLDGLYDYDLSLMYHRFHDNNASNNVRQLKCIHGSSTLLSRTQYVREDVLSLRQFLLRVSGTELCNVDFVTNLIRFEEQRIQLLKSASIVLFVKLLLHCNFNYGLHLVLSDYCYAIGFNAFLGRLYGGVKAILK